MNRNLMLQALFMLHRKTVSRYIALLHGVKSMEVMASLDCQMKTSNTQYLCIITVLWYKTFKK